MVGTSPVSSTRKEVFNENDLNNVRQAIKGNGVVSGCAISWGGVRFYCGSGTILNNGTLYTVAAGYTNDPVIDPLLDTQYIIYHDSADNTVKILAGTPAAPDGNTNYFERYSPAPPSLNAGAYTGSTRTILAQAYIPAGATSFGSANFKDMRVFTQTIQTMAPTGLGAATYMYSPDGINVEWQAISGGSGDPYITNVLTNSALGSELSVGNDGSTYLKTRYPMAIGAAHSEDDFVEVYEDGTLLTYGRDWTFNDSTESTMGRIPTVLSDAIKFPNGFISRGKTYTLRYTERNIAFTPVMAKWSSYHPDQFIHSSAIKSRLYEPSNGSMEDVINVKGMGYQTDVICASRVRSWYYADSIRVSFWHQDADMEAMIGTGTGAIHATFRIEAYKRGARNGNSGVAGRINMSMNCLPCPVATSDTNTMSIEYDLQGGNQGREGIFSFRLRDINNNIVTNFAQERLKVKWNYLWDFRNSQKIGEKYLRTSFM